MSILKIKTFSDSDWSTPMTGEEKPAKIIQVSHVSKKVYYSALNIW